MPKITIEVTHEQKNLFDSLKGSDTNHVLFGKLLNAYVEPKKSPLTLFQADFLAKLGNITLDDHIRFAIDDYVKRLRGRKQRSKHAHKPSKMDAAQEKATALVLSVIRENEAAKSPLNMVYVNLSVLKKKANGHINQSVLQRTLILMKDIIAKHHDKFGLELNHNRNTIRGSKKISDITSG